MKEPRVASDDAAWVYLDPETGLYVLECWVCEIRREFDDHDAAVFLVTDSGSLSSPFRYAPKYLVDTVNGHNARHHKV